MPREWMVSKASQKPAECSMFSSAKKASHFDFCWFNLRSANFMWAQFRSSPLYTIHMHSNTYIRYLKKSIEHTLRLSYSTVGGEIGRMGCIQAMPETRNEIESLTKFRLIFNRRGIHILYWYGLENRTAIDISALSVSSVGPESDWTN